MRKTLLVTTDFAPNVGGVARYNSQIAQSMADNVTVLTTTVGQGSKQVIRTSFLSKWIKPSWLTAVVPVYKTLKQNKCTQIFVSEILPIGPIALILKKVFNVPYVLQIHGMDILQASQSKIRSKIARFVIHNANQVIVNSKYVQSLISEKYGDVQSQVIYPVPSSYPNPDLESIHHLKEKHKLQNKKIILSIGRLVARKGFSQVLGAMSHVWQTDKNVVYVIVGDGEEMDRLVTMAEPHKKQVIMTGKVSDEEKNAWLSVCDIFIMPSSASENDVEGFGIVYLEAHAYKKPVIAGRSGGAVEAVLENITGLLVNPQDIDEIANAIIKLLKNKQLANTLGQAGFERLQNELDWEGQMTKLKELL